MSVLSRSSDSTLTTRRINKPSSVSAKIGAAVDLWQFDLLERFYISPMPWQRPASVSFPSVWGYHVGKASTPGGRVPKFRIQDAPEEMFEEIIEHMCTHFLAGEPMCVIAGFLSDLVSMEEIHFLWKEALKDKMALVALEEMEDGSTKLAGVNVTCISLVEDKDKEYKFEGSSMKKVLGAVMQVTKLADVFELYGVSEYMTAYGLSVDPAYRGQGLGLAILNARTPLCKATGVKLTATVFTAGNSQELARRAQFKLLGQIEYPDLKDEDGKEAFPGIKVKYCMNMALKI